MQGKKEAPFPRSRARKIGVMDAQGNVQSALTRVREQLGSREAIYCSELNEGEMIRMECLENKNTCDLQKISSETAMDFNRPAR